MSVFSCSVSCPLDKYGPTCGKTCSVNCRPQSDAKDRNCSQSDGTCLLGCNPGWQGAKCDKCKYIHVDYHIHVYSKTRVQSVPFCNPILHFIHF